MNKAIKATRFAAVMVGVGLLILVGCSQPAPSGDGTGGGPVGETEDGGTQAGGTQAPPSGDPIRIGGTLALSGPLSATAKIHEIVGHEFVNKLNREGGLLGRPVEWVLYDDESSPDNAAALYERLITEDQVDLIVAPYATAATTAAMQVAERYGYVIVHHTASQTYEYTYERHFSTWPTNLDTHVTSPALVFDAYLSADDPPRTVGFVTSRFPGTLFVVYGHEDQGGAIRVAEEKGLEVVLDLQYDLGTTDFAPIAARIRDADPDLLYVGSLTEAPNLMAAMAQIGYQPRGQFYQWPAPGPMLAAGALAEGATSITIFEAFEPFLSYEGAREFTEIYQEAAAAAGLTYTLPETQAASSWAAWQVLVAGVEGCQCLDHARIAEYLINHEIPTVEGALTFDPEQQNYGPERQVIKQIQDGQWYVVHPEEFATDGRRLIYPTQR